MMTEKQKLTLKQMVAGIILGMIACALITLCSGCTTVREVEVVKVRTDTLIQTNVQRDSIHVRDSVYLHEYTKGDTVYIEKVRYRTDIKERIKIDTIYKSKTDTMVVERTVTKEDTPLTWWQRTKESLFIIAILIILLVFVIYTGKKVLRL